jgi:hypothetical protein
LIGEDRSALKPSPCWPASSPWCLAGSPVSAAVSGFRTTPCRLTPWRYRPLKPLPWCWPQARPRARRARAMAWAIRASTAPGSRRPAGAVPAKAERLDVALAGGSPARAAVSGLRTTPCRSTPWRYRPPPLALEALAVVLAGGSPASAESTGHGLGNPWPRPHREEPCQTHSHACREKQNNSKLVNPRDEQKIGL